MSEGWGGAPGEGFMQKVPKTISNMPTESLSVLFSPVAWHLA